MMIPRITLGLLLALICAQTARAETACGTHSSMIESISLVRQIQMDPGGPNYRVQIQQLNSITGRISLPALIPDDPASSDSTEREALIQYVSALQGAVSSAALGRDGDVRRTLQEVITPQVFSGLSSLGSHWECDGKEPSRQSDVDGNTEMAAFSGSEGGEAQNGESSPADSSASSLNRSTSMGSGNGTASRREAVVTGNTMIFFIMLIVMALLALFFYAQSRARRKTVRETRRALNTLVDVQMDGQNRQMRLVDISMNGFKVSHSGQIDIQEEISLALGGAWHQGQIRWANPHYAGIKFKRAIDPKTLSSAMDNPTDAPPLDAAA